MVLISLLIKQHQRLSSTRSPVQFAACCRNFQERQRGRQGGTPLVSFAAKIWGYQLLLSIFRLII